MSANTSLKSLYERGSNYNLTHWGRMTHICLSKITFIGSDDDFSPGLRQTIIWTHAGILLIEPLGTKFSEILNRNSYIFFQENAFENAVSASMCSPIMPNNQASDTLCVICLWFISPDFSLLLPLLAQSYDFTVTMIHTCRQEGTR